MPREFYKLTIREFFLKLDGFWRRQDREWHRVAELGKWILAPYQAPENRQNAQELLGKPLHCFPIDEDDGDIHDAS